MANDIVKPGPLTNITVLACNPTEMQGAQQQLVDWARQRILAARQDVDDAERSLKAARIAGMGTSRFKSALARRRKQLAYCEKISRALDEGYYIVPPFPVDVFAIRTNRRKPKWEKSADRWSGFRQDNYRGHPILPSGEGQYVSPNPEIWSRMEWRAAKDGTQNQVEVYYPKELQEVEFPFTMVKPEIVEATGKALQNKIFDRIGVLPASQGADPIICGQILKPNRSYYDPVTFFIAWWWDTETL